MEIQHGKRATGGQKKRFSGHVKSTPRKCSVPPDPLEALAADREAWCMGADFHRAVVASAPGRITPHRAPPYEELDLRHEFAHFVLRKINENCCHQSCIL